LDKNTDIGAINSKEQLDRITELVESGVKEGAEIFQPACRLPCEGILFQADRVLERHAEPSHRARGNFRPGAQRADFPHPR